MRSGLLSFAGFSCAALAAGLGWLSTPGELSASNTGLTALADADGDLLDDALELRLGTDPNLADMDLDGRSDLEEHLLGSDPAVYDDPLSQSSGFTAIRFEVYQVGPDFVLELYALVTNRVHSIEIHRALPHENRVFSWRDLTPYVVDNIRVASSLPGFDVQRARLRVDSALLDIHPAIAFGVRALVDQYVLVDAVNLTHSAHYLAELDVWYSPGGTRAALPGGGNNHIAPGELSGNSANGGGGGEQAGGLFPVDPGSGGSTSGSQDEICVQTLIPISNLGGGRVQYVVADAGCDTEVDAVCMPGCELTKDDTVIGIDVVGLLGG